MGPLRFLLNDSALWLYIRRGIRRCLPKSEVRPHDLRSSESMKLAVTVLSVDVMPLTFNWCGLGITWNLIRNPGRQERACVFPAFQDSLSNFKLCLSENRALLFWVNDADEIYKEARNTGKCICHSCLPGFLIGFQVMPILKVEPYCSGWMTPV